jgi:hypothetical protein
MVYSVTYDIKDTERESKFIQALNNEGENVLYMTHCHFLKSTYTHTQVYEHLRAWMDDSDLLFVAKLSLDDMSGWLPNSAVKWIGQAVEN